VTKVDVWSKEQQPVADDLKVSFFPKHSKKGQEQGCQIYGGKYTKLTI
jgi:hypothetical protein